MIAHVPQYTSKHKKERLGALCVQGKLTIWLVQIPKTNEFLCKIQFFFQCLLLCGTRETIAMELYH